MSGEDDERDPDDEMADDDPAEELDETAEEEVEQGDASQRTPLAIALGAAFLLALIVVVVATGGSGGDEKGAPTGICFVAWNDDVLAPTQDGQHAYNAHGYRQTLVARLDRNAQIIESPDDDAAPDDREARCAVIFASPQPDFEPNFGVRVYDTGRWTGLAITDKATLDDIADLQAEAVADSNALLGASGQLASD